MKQITIRKVPSELSAALEKETKRRGSSLNQTAIDLLRQALGIGPTRYNNNLGSLSGTWTNKDLQKFEEATSVFEKVDPELWQ
jgi:plasmid stability protein